MLNLTLQAGEVADVDLESPPSSPLFDLDNIGRNKDETDIGVLASRRRRELQKSSSGAVHVNFDGLDRFVTALRSPFQDATTKVNNTAQNLAPPPPKMELGPFCFSYGLSELVEEKLEQMDVAGPHLLRMIKDEELRDGGFSVGQIAAIRDAYERYIFDNHDTA